MVYDSSLVVGRLCNQLIEAHAQKACSEEVVGGLVEVYVEVSCYYLYSGCVKKRENLCGEVLDVAVFTVSVYIENIKVVEGQLDIRAEGSLVGAVFYWEVTGEDSDAFTVAMYIVVVVV